MIHGIVADAEVGKVYTGKVTRLMNFGAFVEILPGKEGLVDLGYFDNDFIANRNHIFNLAYTFGRKLGNMDQTLFTHAQSRTS